MESNGLPGGMYSNVQQQQQPGIVGLEMSLHHNNRPPQNPHQQIPHHAMGAYAPPDHPDYHHPHHPQPHPKQPQPSYPYAAATKSKAQTLTLSDDDEPGFTPENSADDGARKMSPWQRMKWTDNMVRLLIMVVFYIGDEVGSDSATDPAATKKKGGGALQKKGKWKSVSRAMMERGFYVSPQQCEDKFNDLNKRYKRVNDILGKGTACRVVENQSLLDSMDHLSPKMKEEVKKLLNSKHLFFREMCAYHNSCGHGSGGSSGSVADAAVAEQKQRCLHENASNLNREENEGGKMGKGEGDEDEDEDHDDEEEEEEDEEEEDDEVVGGGLHPRKRARKGAIISPMIQQLGVEVMAVLQDGTKSPSEKIQWMKVKQVQLEEQRIDLHSQALEIEKQRLKWLKFSSKKEREMEREKLVHERMKLENERMVLLIRQKELDLMELHTHHSNNRKSDRDPSSITG